MSKLEFIRALYDYNEWADDHILETASELDEKELARDLGASHGSVGGTLTHLLLGQVFWLGVWGASREGPVAMPRQEPGQVMQPLREGYEQYHKGVRAFVEALTGERIEELILDPVHSPRLSLPMWQMMVHIIYHGINHRSEVAALLTTLGRPVRDLDYIFFERGRQKVAIA